MYAKKLQKLQLILCRKKVGYRGKELVWPSDLVFVDIKAYDFHLEPSHSHILNKIIRTTTTTTQQSAANSQQNWWAYLIKYKIKIKQIFFTDNLQKNLYNYFFKTFGNINRQMHSQTYNSYKVYIKNNKQQLLFGKHISINFAFPQITLYIEIPKRP